MEKDRFMIVERRCLDESIVTIHAKDVSEKDVSEKLAIILIQLIEKIPSEVLERQSENHKLFYSGKLCVERMPEPDYDEENDE